MEKAKGNGLVVKSAKTGIEVSKNAKAAYIRFLKSGAKAHVSVNGEVKSLIVDKKAELKLTGKTEKEIYEYRIKENIVAGFKMVDTCAAEFKSETPYFYSTYEQ